MSGAVKIIDERVCHLGEGPLWHPERGQLFWFDINAKQLLTREASGPLMWQFDEHVSAAGWLDHDTLLIASETALFRFDIATGTSEHVIDLEADNPVTRSNDGRADPWGGFWIGTMGKQAEDCAGAIYRFYQGKLEPLYHDITISNAICFSPDRNFAYYADTPTRQIMRQTLDSEGWPTGPATVFVDLNAEGLNPDGAVVDSEGYLWNAQWGAHRVTRYAPEGRVDSTVNLAASQPSCPAFGGQDLTNLYVTSATESLSEANDADGRVLSLPVAVVGQAEHRVKLV
jgi:sugar lactone lactonase YvrE